MGSLSDVSLGDIARVLARYRPVAVSVGVVLLVLLALPKPDLGPGQALGKRTIETPARTSVSAVADAGPGPEADFAVEPFTPGAPAIDSFAPSPIVPAPSFEASPSPAPGGGPSSFTTATTETQVQPLRVRSSTWATRTAGSPLATNGVPDSTLPVGTRGTDDKLSFLRLTGTSTTLGLAEHPEGNRNNAGPAAVAACRITSSDWKAGKAVAFADAPPYDPTDCVQGVRSSGGVWVFDLGRFSDRTDERGFALVPGDDAGLDFQVAFRLS